MDFAIDLIRTSNRTLAVRSTQPLTESSTRNILDMKTWRHNSVYFYVATEWTWRFYPGRDAVPIGWEIWLAPVLFGRCETVIVSQTSVTVRQNIRMRLQKGKHYFPVIIQVECNVWERDSRTLWRKCRIRGLMVFCRDSLYWYKYYMKWEHYFHSYSLAEFLYPEDGIDTFLRNFYSYKTHTAPHSRRRHFSLYYSLLENALGELIFGRYSSFAD
jgi:hypothetical protein